MSTFNDIDIECPQCGEEFRGTVWVAIHAGQDPELKELMLGGELNLVSCPQCGYVTFQDHFLIYQEPAAELVAYVYPESQRGQEAELRKLMRAGFREAQALMPEKERLGYEPILLFGLEGLIELLQGEIALAEQSQIAQVLCEQNKVDTALLRPAQARRLHTMRVIPFAIPFRRDLRRLTHPPQVPHTGKSPSPARCEVIAGIEKLLEIDPVLDLYAKLKQTIKADPAWTL